MGIGAASETVMDGPDFAATRSRMLAASMLAHPSFLDITAQVSADIDGDTSADTFAELVDRVVATIASDEPRSRIRTASAPDPSGDLLEVVADVVGQPDDSVRGYRLLIVAQMAADIRALGDNGGDDFTTDLGPYTLRSVLATPPCYSHRGISTDGACS